MIQNISMTIQINNIQYLLSSFSLSVSAGSFYTTAKATTFLDISPEIGSDIQVFLHKNDDKISIFKGFIENFNVFNNSTNLILIEGTKKYHSYKILTNYRNETAGNILNDIISEIGINEKNIDFEDVEIERLNLNLLKPQLSLIYLIDTIFFLTGEKIKSFFDSKGVFNFCDENKYINKASIFDFSSGKDIINKFPNHIETFISEIRPLNQITIDGKNYIVNHVVLNHGASSLMRIYYETK